MSDRFLVEHSSPTLAGLKTGSLFSVSLISREDLNRELRELNARLSGKGLRAVPMRCAGGRALIYLYRPDHLKRDLESTEAGNILKSLGYPCGSVNRCVAALEKQFRRGGAFPHEVGLFLGYPSEDVLGFMRDPHRGYKCVGFWKVYGDVERARNLFRRYQSCRAAYAECLRRGKSLEQLIVRTAAAEERRGVCAGRSGSAGGESRDGRAN